MSNYEFSGSVKEDYAVLVKKEQHPSKDSTKEEVNEVYSLSYT